MPRLVRLIETFDGAAHPPIAASGSRSSQADERFISFANEYLCPDRLPRWLSDADDAEDYRTWRVAERRSSAILQFCHFAVAMLRTARRSRKEKEGEEEGETDETKSFAAAAAAAASWLHVARTNME